MADLRFESLPGTWKGNDYSSVSITSVSVGSDERPVAFVFMTHMNVDFDGAPNCYGPPEKSPLDSLADAGRFSDGGYYGLVAVGPNEMHKGKKIKDLYHLKLDERFPDKKGRCPVVQQTGKYAGYYVSTTSKASKAEGASGSQYDQSHYIDSGSIPYCALSYGLQSKGIGDKDFGIAVRHDTFNSATFAFLGGEGHGKGSPNAGAVGECSYKVFLDIGGTPKTSHQKYANNNFPTTFIVFPRSDSSQLLKISLADNAEDFAVFVALQAEVDAAGRGHSALPKFRKYLSDGRKSRPAKYSNVAAALRPLGYVPDMATAGSIVVALAGAAGRMIP